MTTATPTPAEIAAMERAYSLDYQMARAKFLEAAAAAGGEIQHHLVLRSGTVDYYMDTAFFPGAKGKKMLVHASGTHGVEGYTGSAIQVKLLEEWDKEKAQAGPSVLFVHAINPYGMAHYRRFNENNVDLNRNFLTAEEWEKARAREPDCCGYETIVAPLALPHAPTAMDWHLFFPRLVWHAAWAGALATKRALVSGQYHSPSGVYYGGRAEQQSIRLLREVLGHYGKRAPLDEVVVMDVHTGLGPKGEDTMMVQTDAEAAQCRAIFGAGSDAPRVQSDASATDGPSAGYDMAMGFIYPSAADFGATPAATRVLSMTEEFGTVLPPLVLRAVMLENAAYQHDRGGLFHEELRRRLRDVFYLADDVQFKLRTLRRGASAFRKVVAHLSA